MKLSIFLKRSRFKIRLILILIGVLLLFYGVYFVFEARGHNEILRQKFWTFVYRNNFFARRSDIPLYEITIPQSSWDELEAEMPPDHYVLENPFSWHPATFEFEGKKYDVELKYRGVYDGHWRHEKKNMAIRFPKDNLFKNRERLLLIIPEAMSMMPNSMNSYSSSIMGLPSPKTIFVQVEVNGQYWGVYEDSENVDESFLENHGLAKGDIYDIELDADSFLLNKWANEDYGVHWNRLSTLPDRDMKDTTMITKLIHTLNLESDAEFKREIEKILDIEEYLHWAAHNAFPGTTRQSDHNVKLYFNPEVNKFWQIPWDLEGYSYNGHKDFSINITSNGLMNRILKFPDYNHRKNQIIWKYLNAELSGENQLAKMEEFYNEIRYGIYKDPYKRATRLATWYSNNEYDKAVQEMRDWIAARDKNLRFQMDQSNAMIKFENQGFGRGANNYYLRFRLSTAWGVGAHVKELDLPLISDNSELLNNLVGWELYRDYDRDGQLTSGDELVLSGESEEGGKVKILLDTLIFPDKSIHDPIQPVWKLEMFKDPIASFDYIVKLSFKPGVIIGQDENVAVGREAMAVCFNAVTAESIIMATSFTDEIYYDFSSKQASQAGDRAGLSFRDALKNEETQ